MSRRPAGFGPRIRWFGRAYQGALEAVLALAIMGLLGAAADAHYGTSPALLIVGLTIGFGSFVLRMVRLARELRSEEGDGGEDTPGRGP